MLQATILERVFIYDTKSEQIELEDPAKQDSPEQVLSYYTSTYPMLNNAKIEGPTIKDDRVEYRFVSTIGTKG